MRLALWSLLLLPGVCSAEKFAVRDEGDFAPSGRHVEFADRFGWKGYRVDFDFGFDEGRRSLARGSRLKIRIERKDGSSWSHACKAKGRGSLSASVNPVYNRGLSVVAECRVPAEDFAEAVGLHPDDVGLPMILFQVFVSDGKVVPGSQRGLYFLPAGRIESSELGAYATGSDEATSLAVVFRGH